MATVERRPLGQGGATRLGCNGELMPWPEQVRPCPVATDGTMCGQQPLTGFTKDFRWRALD